MQCWQYLWGHTHTHTVTHTHTFCQKCCQIDLRHATIQHHCLGPPLRLHPQNHDPAPRLIGPASEPRPSQGPANPAQLCAKTNSYPTTRAQPCTRTVRCHPPSSLPATIPPTDRLRADGGSGLTAGPSPSSLPRPSARPSPRKAGRSGGLRLPTCPASAAEGCCVQKTQRRAAES